MILIELFFTPFNDYAFMRRALATCAAIAIGGAPLGVFLVLRRMTLVGDVIAHAILPGAAIAFLCFGFSLTAMTIGGLGAGLIIAIIASLLTQVTQLKEDASFTGIYLISLAAGVLIISLHGSTLDLMHVLFGNVLATNNASLLMVCGITSVSALVLAAIYRSLIVHCFDTGFLRSMGTKTVWIDLVFLSLMVLNLVSAFQALGTLMALSIIVLPAIASRFWTSSIDGAIGFSVALSLFASYAGLLLSYHFNLPSGPAIVLFAGGLYVVSLLFGRYGSVRAHFSSRKHFAS
jgi:zinc/manganese transport system permease protein